MPPPDPSSLAYAAASNPWFSWQYVTDNHATILAALRVHTLLTVETVLLASAIAIPLAVLAYWVRPLAAPIPRRAGVLRGQVLVESESRAAMQAFLTPWLEGVRALPKQRNVRWSIDVDPVDLY